MIQLEKVTKTFRTGPAPGRGPRVIEAIKDVDDAIAGSDYAAASLTKADPFYVEPMQKTQGKIIIDGKLIDVKDRKTGAFQKTGFGVMLAGSVRPEVQRLRERTGGSLGAATHPDLVDTQRLAECQQRPANCD